MSGQQLSDVFGELLGYLGGTRTPVFIRVYQFSGGEPAAGVPPARVYADHLISPPPVVIDSCESGERLAEVVAGNRQQSGLRKLILHGEAPVVAGTRLYFDEAEWEVIRIAAPVIYNTVPLKLALARRLLQ